MAAAVTTSQGTLVGTVADGVCAFRGIPFAGPPVGDARFRPPGPPRPWTGPRDASGFGAQAMQSASGLGMLGFDQATMDEDCLFLNVWTPGPGRERRPVLVWIHGGAFVIGAGSQLLYDGAGLARRGDVVVVTINYRLGAFGFLHHPPASGNEGLLDQIAALEWVRDEIAAFGGDPGNVTVFGESAGAISVATLLATPRAQGLFHRAILQSGAGNAVISRERARAVTGELLTELRLPADDGAGLAQLSAARLLDAQRAVFQRSFTGGAGLPFAPVIDGEILPTDPLAAIAGGRAAGVPVLIGTTLEEMKLFSIMDPQARTMDETLLLARLEKRIPGRARAALETYRTARAARDLDVSPAELWCAIESDRFFRAPAMQLAAAHRVHVPRTFAYLFTWRSPLLNGALGACHGLDLPFVFGMLKRGPVALFAGSGPQAEALADGMQDAWLAFARTGDPSTPALGAWPAYDGEQRATMILGAECAVEHAPFETERRFWDGP